MQAHMIIILSGGLDSAVLMAQVIETGNKVSALTFDYGSKHNEMEGVAASRLCEFYDVPYKRIHLPLGDILSSHLLESGGAIPHGHYEDPTMKKTVVPFRNTVMIAVALGYAESLGCDGVFFGAHAGDHAIYPDCRPAFIAAMREVARLGGYKHLKLDAPFALWRKSEIVTLGRKLDVPLWLTYSCYEGRAEHCGLCGTCVERKEAFQLAEMDDPTTYE
jgi:7-cyano-7-deazaguanine synthase